MAVDFFEYVSLNINYIIFSHGEKTICNKKTLSNGKSNPKMP